MNKIINIAISFTSWILRTIGILLIIFALFATYKSNFQLLLKYIIIFFGGISYLIAGIALKKRRKLILYLALIPVCIFIIISILTIIAFG